MNKSESIKELAVALSKAQSEMPPAEMKSVNPFFKSKYADLGSVIKSASPVLAKHGLSISQMPISDNGNIGLTTILMHSSGEWIESTIFMPLGEEAGRSAAQAAGSIITYLRRYSFASALGMYADEDTDGNAPQQKTQSKRQPAKKAEPKTNGNIFKALAEAGLSENEHAAKNALQNYCKTGYDTYEKAADWFNLYRGWRDLDKTPQEAGELANAGEVPA